MRISSGNYDYYHPGGSVEQVVEGEGLIATSFEYDDINRLTRQTKISDGIMVDDRISYTEFNGGMIVTQRPASEYSGPNIVKKTYDRAGRIRSVWEGEVGLYRHSVEAYDALGRPKRKFRGNREVSYVYNPLETVETAGQVTIRTRYDLNGNMAFMESTDNALTNNAHSQVFTYDEMNRPHTEQSFFGKESLGVLTYHYWGWDREGITYPNGLIVGNQANDLGQIRELVFRLPAEAEHKWMYEYQPANGLLKEVKHYNVDLIDAATNWLYTQNYERRRNGTVNWTALSPSIDFPGITVYGWRVDMWDQVGRPVILGDGQLGGGIDLVSAVTYTHGPLMPQEVNYEFGSDRNYKETYQWQGSSLKSASREIKDTTLLGEKTHMFNRVNIFDSGGRVDKQSQTLSTSFRVTHSNNPAGLILNGMIDYSYDRAGNLIREVVDGEVVGLDELTFASSLNVIVSKNSDDLVSSLGDTERYFLVRGGSAPYTISATSDVLWLDVFPRLDGLVKVEVNDVAWIEGLSQLVHSPALAPPDYVLGMVRIYIARVTISVTDLAGNILEGVATYTLMIDDTDSSNYGVIVVTGPQEFGSQVVSELQAAADAIDAASVAGAYTITLGSHLFSPANTVVFNGLNQNAQSLIVLGENPDATSISLPIPGTGTLFQVNAGLSEIEFKQLKIVNPHVTDADGIIVSVDPSSCHIVETSFEECALENIRVTLGSCGLADLDFEHVTYTAAGDVDTRLVRTTGDEAGIDMANSVVVGARTLLSSATSPADGNHYLTHSHIYAGDQSANTLGWMHVTTPSTVEWISSWDITEISYSDPSLDPSLHLQPDSTAIRAANNGYDQGAFYLDFDNPDLTVSVVDQTVVSGGNQLTLRISNVENVDVMENFYLDVALDSGSNVAQQLISGLAATTHIDRVVTVLQDYTPAEVIIRVDASNQVSELSEYNNTLTRTLNRDLYGPGPVYVSVSEVWTTATETLTWTQPLDTTLDANGRPVDQMLVDGEYVITVTRQSDGSSQTATVPVSNGQSMEWTLAWILEPPAYYTVRIHAVDAEGNEGASGNESTFTTGVFMDREVALPKGYVGQFYRGDVRGFGGVGSLTYVLTAGALPVGITLTLDGYLEGIPDIGAIGSYPGIVVEAIDQHDQIAIVTVTNTLVIEHTPVPGWWSCLGAGSGVTQD